MALYIYSFMANAGDVNILIGTQKIRPGLLLGVFFMFGYLIRGLVTVRARGTLRHRLSNVDREAATVELLVTQKADGVLSFLVAGHLDKAEALRAAGVAVHDDLGTNDGTSLGKSLSQSFVCGVERQ